LRQLCQFNI